MMLRKVYNDQMGECERTLPDTQIVTDPKANSTQAGPRTQLSKEEAEL